MAEDTRDTLMMMIQNGKPIPAEASALIAGDDPLAEEFRRTQVSKNAWSGSFFALTDFRLEVGLLPESSPDEAEEARLRKKQDQVRQQQIQTLMEAQKNAAQGKPPLAGKNFNQYPRFMRDGSAGLRRKAYTTDLEPVQVGKQMDRSSLTLFDAALNFKVFDSAIVLKRRGIGEQMLRSFLQIRFTSLLITDFDWQEDDTVKETFKFVCRKAEICYAVQDDKGVFKIQPAQGWSLLNLKN